MVTGWIFAVATSVVANLWMLRSWWLVRMAYLTQLKVRQHNRDSDTRVKRPKVIIAGDVFFRVRVVSECARDVCHVVRAGLPVEPKAPFLRLLRLKQEA